MQAEGAQVFVVLSHLGFNDGGYGYGFTVYGDKTLAQKLIDASTPVNLIIGGHSHTDLGPVDVPPSPPPPNYVVIGGKTSVVQAYYNGRRLGRADITVTDGGVSVAWQSINVRTTYAQDPAVKAIIDAYVNDPWYQALINQPIGYAQVDLFRDYNGDNMMGDFIDGAIYNQLNSDGDALNDVDMFFNNAGGSESIGVIKKIHLALVIGFGATWLQTVRCKVFGAIIR